MITELEMRSYRDNLPWPQCLVLDIEYARVRRCPRMARLLAWVPLCGLLGAPWFYLGQPDRGWRQVRLTLLLLVPGVATWLLDATRMERICDAHNRAHLREIFARLKAASGRPAQPVS
jgi:hypothetical protein